MPIESLLKSEKIKKQNTILKIDYSNLDPHIMKHTEETILKVEETLSEARDNAASMLADARNEADAILTKAHNEAEKIRTNEREIIEIYKTTEYEQLEKYISAKQSEIADEREAFNEKKVLELNKIQDSKEDVRESIVIEIEQEERVKAKEDAKATFDRLIAQVHSVLNEVIKRRNKMLLETEKEIVSLVLLIARKVVKAFSEKDDTVVIKNIVEALSKLKGREKFIIRVNVSQLEYVKKEIAYVKEQLETEAIVTVLEDTTVELGGCVIESDFGEIDARISTQMAEIEKSVRTTGFVGNVGV